MASKDDIIAELRRIVDAQVKQIVAQAKRIDELELKLAKAFKDSSNSSKSPSSDIVKPPFKKQSAVGKGKKAKRGVEPTNNHSEQQVRHCVIDRRITQGTRSASGQRYHERMWTAIATCGKQGRSFFQFLHESISANLSGGESPMLLSE